MPPNPPSNAHGFAMRSMSLRDMQIPKSEKKNSWPPPLPNPGDAPVYMYTQHDNVPHLHVHVRIVRADGMEVPKHTHYTVISINNSIVGPTNYNSKKQIVSCIHFNLQFEFRNQTSFRHAPSDNVHVYQFSAKSS